MQRYKHVIVIGIDGMGSFNRVADTPCLDRIFADGAVTYEALSMVPTISAQNWGGMLLGCDPVVHKLTNSIVSSRLYENKDMPSVFRRIREKYPEAVLASYCNWNPINYGIIEHDTGVDFATEGNDDVLTSMIVEKIKDRPDFFFIQLDNTDGAGHRHGYGAAGHIEEIERADKYVGRIYNEYRRLGMLDDTLFIVTSDHGGFKNSHGGYSQGERYVFLAAAGKGVRKGKIADAYTKDISAIVLYALGIDVPGYTPGGYTSQVPLSLFENYDGGYILPDTMRFEARQMNTVPFTDKNGLGTLFGEKLRLAMFFDNSLCDETGNFTVSEKRTFKYYSDGAVSFCGEGGANGCAVVKDFSVGENSFAVALWIETQLGLVEETAVCGNKFWDEKNDNDKGWNIVLRSHDVLFFLANGERRNEYVIPFEPRDEDGWVHILFSVDRENNKTEFYVNFIKILTADISEEYRINLDNRELYIGNDSSDTYNNICYSKTFRMDDLLIFDGAATERDAEILKNYYKKEQL